MKSIWVIIFTLLFSLSSFADSSSQKSGFISDISSPLTKPAIYYLAGGTAVTLFLISADDSVDRPLQKEATENEHRLTNLGKIGGMCLANLAYVAAMESTYLLTNDKLYRDLSLLMIKASAYTFASTFLLKYATQETRPDGSDRMSFPSGHSSVTFAFASVVAEEHQWYYGAAAYSFASLVAYSRMNDNRHWFHDVVAGATIGMSYGIGLATNLNKKLANDSKITFHALPTDDLHGATFFADLNI